MLTAWSVRVVRDGGAILWVGTGCYQDTGCRIAGAILKAVLNDRLVDHLTEEDDLDLVQT